MPVQRLVPARVSWGIVLASNMLCMKMPSLQCGASGTCQLPVRLPGSLPGCPLRDMQVPYALECHSNMCIIGAEAVWKATLVLTVAGRVP